MTTIFVHDMIFFYSSFITTLSKYPSHNLKDVLQFNDYVYCFFKSSSFCKRIMFSESIFKLHSSSFVSVQSCHVKLMRLMSIIIIIRYFITRCIMLWVCGFLREVLLGVCKHLVY